MKGNNNRRMQIEWSFPSEQLRERAYLGQERAGEGFAVGEVRVAQPDMLVARKTPARQPVAAQKKKIIGTIRGASAIYVCCMDQAVIATLGQAGRRRSCRSRSTTRCHRGPPATASRPAVPALRDGRTRRRGGPRTAAGAVRSSA